MHTSDKIILTNSYTPSFPFFSLGKPISRKIQQLLRFESLIKNKSNTFNNQKLNIMTEKEFSKKAKEHLLNKILAPMHCFLAKNIEGKYQVLKHRKTPKTNRTTHISVCHTRPGNKAQTEISTLLNLEIKEVIRNFEKGFYYIPVETLSLKETERLNHIEGFHTKLQQMIRELSNTNVEDTAENTTENYKKRAETSYMISDFNHKEKTNPFKTIALKDISFLGELTMSTINPIRFDKYKDLVFKTIGYIEGEPL